MGYLQGVNLNLWDLNQRRTKEKQVKCLKQNQGNQVSLHCLIAPSHHFSEWFCTVILKRYQSSKDAFKFISIRAEQESISYATL